MFDQRLYVINDVQNLYVLPILCHIDGERIPCASSLLGKHKFAALPGGVFFRVPARRAPALRACFDRNVLCRAGFA